MVVDFASVFNYDHQRNARAATFSDVENFFWTRNLVSHLAICITDAAIGALIWASATNRAFVVPPSPAVILESQTRVLEKSLAKFRSLGAVRNVVMRESGFRAKVGEYWRKEGEIMHEVLEERDVVEAVNEVLAKMDVDGVTKGADEFVEQVLGPMA